VSGFVEVLKVKLQSPVRERNHEVSLGKASRARDNIREDRGQER
jgi:hypothetical protein